ncbi:hypothetical protein GCM10029964_078330 [Kibdelosporangium lantanae]
MGAVGWKRVATLVLAGVVCCLVAYAQVRGLVVRRQLTFGVSLALAVFQAVPVFLVVFRPVLAWSLSLSAMVVTAAVPGAVVAGTPWPWTEAALVAHLVVTLVSAWWGRVGVVAGQWAGTVVVALALTLWGPVGANDNLRLFAVFSVPLLALLLTIRSRRDVVRRLRTQEAVTNEERARRAVLEERTRIARELHDVVAHHMSLVAVQSEAAPYRVTDPPRELVDAFGSIRQNALAALTEMRHVLGMLRADDHDTDTPLAPQPGLDDLDRLLANARDAGMRVEEATHGTPRPLPTGVGLSAYRIVQEALSNAVRHAPGSSVRVDVRYEPDELALTVVNSSTPTRPRPGSGHGLVGMRERASSVGGSLRAGWRADGWYEVSVSLPTEGSGGP